MFLLLFALLLRSSNGNQLVDNLVVFGEDFSDDGVDVSSDLCGVQRNSNGPIWADYFAQRLGLSGTGIKNFAFSGAGSGWEGKVGNWSGTLWQIERSYYCGFINSFSRDSLVVLQFAGINDILAGRKTSTVIDNFIETMKVLALKGARRVIVLNMVDPIKAPGWKNSPYQQMQRMYEMKFEDINYFIANAFTGGALAIPADMSVTFIDWNTAFDALKNQYKTANYPYSDSSFKSEHTVWDFVWYDEWFPTTAFHKTMADFIFETWDRSEEQRRETTLNKQTLNSNQQIQLPVIRNRLEIAQISSPKQISHQEKAFVDELKPQTTFEDRKESETLKVTQDPITLKTTVANDAISTTTSGTQEEIISLKNENITSTDAPAENENFTINSRLENETLNNAVTEVNKEPNITNMGNEEKKTTQEDIESSTIAIEADNRTTTLQSTEVETTTENTVYAETTEGPVIREEQKTATLTNIQEEVNEIMDSSDEIARNNESTIIPGKGDSSTGDRREIPEAITTDKPIIEEVPSDHADFDIADSLDTLEDKFFKGVLVPLSKTTEEYTFEEEILTTTQTAIEAQSLSTEVPIISDKLNFTSQNETTVEVPSISNQFVETAAAYTLATTMVIEDLEFDVAYTTESNFQEQMSDHEPTTTIKTTVEPIISDDIDIYEFTTRSGVNEDYLSSPDELIEKEITSAGVEVNTSAEESVKEEVTPGQRNEKNFTTVTKKPRFINDYATAVPPTEEEELSPTYELYATPKQDNKLTESETGVESTTAYAETTEEPLIEEQGNAAILADVQEEIKNSSTEIIAEAVGPAEVADSSHKSITENVTNPTTWNAILNRLATGIRELGKSEIAEQFSASSVLLDKILTKKNEAPNLADVRNITTVYDEPTDEIKSLNQTAETESSSSSTKEEESSVERNEELRTLEKGIAGLLDLLQPLINN